jgi:hypothetical protein
VRGVPRSLSTPSYPTGANQKLRGISSRLGGVNNDLADVSEKLSGVNGKLGPDQGTRGSFRGLLTIICDYTASIDCGP